MTNPGHSNYYTDHVEILNELGGTFSYMYDLGRKPPSLHNAMTKAIKLQDTGRINELINHYITNIYGGPVQFRGYIKRSAAEINSSDKRRQTLKEVVDEVTQGESHEDPEDPEDRDQDVVPEHAPEPKPKVKRTRVKKVHVNSSLADAIN